MPYPMIIPQYSPVMMAGGGSAVQSAQRQGRNGDSMLVHMNPREVAGLQALARKNGTSLTINPQTGLPEAFNLGSILPAVAGAALTPVLGPMAPLVVGGLGALATGSLEQGLMMGLGAFGGAGLAGSAANLAAPAAMATEAAALAAPAAVGGAAGATGIAASAAPAATLAQAANLAPAASVGGLGLQAPALSAIAPDTIAAISSPLPAVSEAANLAGAATGSTGISALPTPALNVGTASQATMPFAGSEAMSNMVAPPASFGSRVMEGFGKVFESPSSLMNFAKENKMDIASSLAPALIPETPEEAERKRAMIRPYEYQVDNLSDAPIDLAGRETERYRGRFVEKEPYYAAKGGLMSFAEGGSSGSSAGESSGDSFAMSPGEAQVYSQIAAVQRAAGIPALDTSRIQTMTMDRPNFSPRPYTPLPFPSTIERGYDIYRPVAEDSPSYREIAEGREKEESGVAPDETDPFVMNKRNINKIESGEGFKRGGNVKSVRKPISRTDPFYEFGLDMSKIAEEQFVGGGMAGYSYDPTTNSYKMAKGGLTSLKAGGLREGAFIVPADVISHLGNGSSEAGMKIVQERLKGRPIKGPGDGMSDSIPTTIAGKRPARVANEEAEIPPEVVAALGDGSMEKGAKKLYEMMDKIRQDRTGKKKQAPAVKADKYVPA
jgi:hypothetical protein